MDKLMEILDKFALNYMAIQGSTDDVDIIDRDIEKLLDQAHAQILELMVMGEEEIRNTLGDLMSKENLSFQITGGHPQDMLIYVAHAIHTALLGRVK